MLFLVNTEGVPSVAEFVRIAPQSSAMAPVLSALRAEIACAVVGSARPVVEEILRAADRAVEEADGVRIVDTVTQFR
jgi:hypothetical protein